MLPTLLFIQGINMPDAGIMAIYFVFAWVLYCIYDAALEQEQSTDDDDTPR